MTRPADHVGELPHGYGIVDYPNLGFHGENVMVTFKRRSIYPRKRKENRLVIIPTTWFYK